MATIPKLVYIMILFVSIFLTVVDVYGELILLFYFYSFFNYYFMNNCSPMFSNFFSYFSLQENVILTLSVVNNICVPLKQ